VKNIFIYGILWNTLNKPKEAIMFTRKKNKQNGWKMGKIILFGLLFLVPFSLVAQEYPTKPINLIVSHGPGGTMDVSARLLAKSAEKILGQPFVITNNGGGGGSVAFGILQKEKPDGYYLVSGADFPTVLLPQFRDLPYKFEDFTFVMEYGESQTTAILVRADSPWKTLKDLVEYAKKNPNKVSWGVSGVGTGQYLAMAYVARQEGIQWTAVPYPSGDPNLLLLGNNVQAGVSGASHLPFVKAGQLRILATCGTERPKSSPEVPTLKELGYDYSTVARCIISAPKGTPLPVVKKLDDAFRRSMDNPEFTKYMESFDYTIKYVNHEELMPRQTQEKKRIEKLITELKIPKEK
jgi:tripartite-type tricarboxylate transporter receptor subunit TctC